MPSIDLGLNLHWQVGALFSIANFPVKGHVIVAETQGSGSLCESVGSKR